ncbi:hypothetical protein WN943_022586 [Citrus x changshan-huyou]
MTPVPGVVDRIRQSKVALQRPFVLQWKSTSFIKFSLTSLLWIVVLDEIHGCKACLEAEMTKLLSNKKLFCNGSTSFIKFSLSSLLWIVVLDEIHGSKACLEAEMMKLLVQDLTMMKECRLIVVMIGRERRISSQ